MKRAFIFGFLDFPRGSASANYVQNLALAIKDIGYIPIVISSGDTTLCEFDEQTECYLYEGIYFVPYVLKKNRILHYIQFRYFLGQLVIRALKKMKCQKQDIIIAYSLKPTEMEPVFKFARKKKILTISCITELFPATYFPKGEKDASWKEYKRCITKSIQMADKQWPISTYIDNYLEDYKCDTLIIPPMVDTENIIFDGKHRCNDKVRIIFSGNRTIKDALIAMASSVVNVNKRNGREIELYITGVRGEFFEGKPEIQAEIGKTIILHDWMTYNELQLLYRKMDFILLAREINQITLANFPSKIPEALAYGVIPIVSRVGDYTEFYLEDGKNSIIFEGATTIACEEALQRALSMNVEEIEIMSKEARILAEKCFDYHVWSKQIEEHIYTGLHY